MSVKILIVDDREDNHISFKAIFEDKDYTFVDALSGQEALRILLDNTDFTLIIMDVVMPGMNGFETASYISRRKKLKDIPILFLTARDEENQIFKAFDIGAVDYLSKPVIPDLLRAKVRVFVELSKKNKALEMQKQKLKQINDELTLEIKERRASEKKIRLLNEELSAKLKELEALDAFSYSVAHDFKSPINNISMMTQLMRMGEKVSEDEDTMELVNRIDRQVFKLSNLIEDLLMFSHQETQIEKEKIDVDKIVREVVEELKFAYKTEGKCRISISSLPPAHGNPGLITQVWVNLISNAIKYSQQCNNPTVEIFSEKSNDTQIYVVKDNGIGFDEKESQNLFKIFNRLESAKKIEGSGVGLALVKRIIEKHGGKIWACSEPNKATRFSFHL